MIKASTELLYKHLYLEGQSLLAFALWWQEFAVIEWHKEQPKDLEIQDAFETWCVKIGMAW